MPEQPDQAERPSWPNLFDERIARTYDADSGFMFDPAVVGATVDFLAGLAGDGAALEFAIGTGSYRAALERKGCPGPGHRPVARHGGAAAGQTWRRGDRGDRR